MADIKTITLPSGTTYNLVDQGARDLIAELMNFTTYLGVTTTPLTDGASTNPIQINGESVTATNGDVATYQHEEFIFNGTIWQKFGDLSSLGALAFKDSASGSFTPHGSVSTPTITVTPTTGTVNSITDVGTLPDFSATVSNENLTLGWSAGTLPTKGSDTTVATGIQSATSTQPTFTGTSETVTVS